MSGIDIEKFNEIPQLKKCLNAARLTTVHKSNEDWVKYIWDNAIEYAEEQAAKRNTNSPTVQREGWVIFPIDHDADINRFYIPLPAGWEVQTKGKGSSFRICDTKTHERVHVLDERLQPVIEQMAREIHNACNLDSIRLDWLQVNFDSALTRENIDKAIIQAAPTDKE